LVERYRFFDSIDGTDERSYTADEFAEYFRQFIRNGVFNGNGNNLQVATLGQDMKTYIWPGYAWVEGYLYKVESEPLELHHSSAHASYNRIDRVVLRLDKTLENRYVKAFVLTGTPAETPQVPELTRDENIYELALAQVEILTGKSFIESFQVTDERLNNEVCGVVTHLFEQVDTTAIFNEWLNYLNHKTAQADTSFLEMLSVWDQWVENKLSEPGGAFFQEWKTWFDEIQDTTNLVTKSQFKEHQDNHSAHNNMVNAIIFG